MKKIILLLVSLLLLSTTGCSSINNNYHQADQYFHELDKYLFEVDEYTSLDYDYADEYFANTDDNWGGGCSAISKMVDGHRLIGRNMDLNITNKCAYIIRTDNGKFKTIGLAYTFRECSPDYDKIDEIGFSEEYYKTLPFMCDDILNNAGLHIEINMRHAEYWPNGGDKYSCSGTNPDSTDRINIFEVPRYIADHCATVEETKEYVKTLDIYSKKGGWNFNYLISDAEGNSSVLEVASNNIYWLDEDKIKTYDWLKKYNTKAIGQTNFYLNEDCWKTQDTKSGEGRFTAIQNGIDKVKSRSDMYDLIRKVQYSNYYLGYDECNDNYFDPLSELIGEADVATYDFVYSPENKEICIAVLDGLAQAYGSMTRQERQDANEYWESSYTEVVDTNTKEIFVRFFEDEERLYLLGFNGTIKLNSISDWK